MVYSDEYLYSKDIDWFCVINGYYVHVASAGDLLPAVINDREILRDLQHQVAIAEDIFNDDEIIVNDVFLQNRFQGVQNQVDSYLESFISMARKGFISIDKTRFGDPEDKNYHIVCRPREPRALQGYNGIHIFEGIHEPVKDNDFLMDQFKVGIQLISLLE